MFIERINISENFPDNITHSRSLTNSYFLNSEFLQELT